VSEISSCAAPVAASTVAASTAEGLVHQLVAETFGGVVRSSVRMAYGHGSVTYRVAVEDASLIVRTNVDPNVYSGTLANLDTLRALGLPVPTVLGSDLSRQRFPFAYVITDTFAGRDLGYELAEMTGAQMTSLAEQIVGFERRASRLPLSSRYGFMPIGAAGTHARWIDAVRADRGEVLSGDVTAGAVTAGAVTVRSVVAGDDAELSTLIDDVNRLFDRVEPRLDRIEPTCFLDDLTTKNVMVHAGALQGVVDFDVVCYGDPMYWLALTQVAVLSDVGAPGQFYVDELTRLWSPSAFERANLALYSGLHAIEFLSWPTAGDGDGYRNGSDGIGNGHLDAGNSSVRRARLIEAVRSWVVAAD
jgi:aminoglycoside phosphotransferase (APT) family kinase protein